MISGIPALTGLRGIAALWVFVFHVSGKLLRLGPEAHAVGSLFGAGGFLGVDLFFVLSGFVLALNYSSVGIHRSASSYAGFLWKRIARIYPVHQTALALAVILVVAFAAFDSVFVPASRLALTGLLKSLTLTQAWSIPVERTWNAVSWSISCEWAAYLAFPWIVWAANRLRSGLGIFAIVIALFAALAYAVLSGPYATTMEYALQRIAVEFTAGVLLYRARELRNFPMGPRGDWIAMASLAILIVGGNLLATRASSCLALVYMPIFACGVVYGLASGTGLFCRALSCRAALAAGLISYAFYMVHSLILGAAGRVLVLIGKAADPPMFVTAMVMAALVSTALAAAIYAWIETPARRIMVRWSGDVAGTSSRELPSRGH